MRRLLIVLLVLVIGGGAGFLAGRYSILRRNPMMGIEVPETPPKPRLQGKSRVLDALLLTDAIDRVRAVVELDGLSQEEIGDLRVGIRNGAVDRGYVEKILLVRLWARQDPAAAARWSFANPLVGAAQPAAIAVAIEEYAKVDPQAAAQMVEERTRRLAGDRTEEAVKALMRGWFDSGQYEGVEDYLLSWGVSFDRERAIKAFVRRMTQVAGPRVAIEWAEALGEEDWRFKGAAYRQTANEVGKADPSLAIEWCEKVCDGQFGGELEKQIALGWSMEDGQAAVEWLGQMEEGQERDRAVSTVYRFWWQQNRAEARSWIESVGRDGFEAWMGPIPQVYATALAREEPLEAIQWALLVPKKGQQQEQTLVTIARIWRRSDEAAAEAWLESSPLSEEARERARGRPGVMSPEPPAKR